jgi:hypothetical protein
MEKYWYLGMRDILKSRGKKRYSKRQGFGKHGRRGPSLENK